MSLSILKPTKFLLMAGGLLLLSGCAVSPDACQASDTNASLLKKMNCDLSSDGYSGEVRKKEQELANAKAENELFHQVYQDILAQQADTKKSLSEQRQQQQQLDRSLTKLLQQIKGRHSNKSQVQQQIAALESEMATVRNQDHGNSSEEVARKLAELKALQQQVSRLQLSLGY